MGNQLVDWVKKELEARHWSQRELARKSRISHAYIADVLRGDKEVTWNFCLSVANGFNEPVWKLFVLAGLIDTLPSEALDDEQERLVIKIFRELPDQAKGEAFSYLQWLTAKHTK